MKITSELNAIDTPGFGLIVHSGAEIFSQFLGRRTLKPARPLTRDTRFRVASVSKMFTIFGVMLLVERGKISLDEDAGKYLGFELRNPTCPRKITVRMLASHTSGLRDGKIYSIPPNFSVEEFFKPHGKFWENGAHFAPQSEPVGEYFSYSNLNYGLLGTIVEAVTGQRFDEYQRENVFAPLEIRAEYLPGNFSAADFANLGTTYQKKNPAGQWNEFGEWFGKADDFRGVQPARDTVALQNPYAENFQGTYDLSGYRVGTNATIFSPQGGLRISYTELSHVLEMLLSGGKFRGRQILSGESLAEMFRPQWSFDGKNGDTDGGAFKNYGLGTYSTEIFGRRWLGHAGSAFGLQSGIFVSGGAGFTYMFNGTAVSEDDERSRGKVSGNYIWEEKIFHAVTALTDKKI